MKRKNIYNLIKNNILIIKNFSYISALQLFIILSPLLTYPYLVKTLGVELYGWVITAQIVASYCSIFIDWGFKKISAKHIVRNQNDKTKLSEIISSILIVQFSLTLFAFLIYFIIILSISSYRQHLILFIFSFGLVSNELLFPQYYYQGIEKMEFITILNIIIRGIFIVLIFIIIKEKDDYIFVPLIQTIGMIIGGGASMYIIFVKHKIKFYIPTFDKVWFYMKDATPIFFTDAICTIKDKLNYILLGSMVGVKDVVLYDISAKISSLSLQPVSIFNTVIFPRMALKQNNKLFIKLGVLLFLSISLVVLILNIFLEPIVYWFIKESVDLLPVRLYLLSPIFLCVGSFISSNLFVARGYNKLMLYSILVTTFVYLLLLLILLFNGYLNTITSFVTLTVASYFTEMVYRLYMGLKIINKK